MEFRPCIDIHNGKVKQIVGGSLRDQGDFAKENFVSQQDASFFADLYKNAGLAGGHIILLNNQNSEFYEATRKQAFLALHHFPGGLQVGGGITAENAAQFLKEGASHVIVTSYVFQNGVIRYDHLKKLKDTIGREHLVLDLSCKKTENGYRIVTDRWQNLTETIISEPLMECLAGYCDEFLVHAVDVEGKSNGIEEQLAAFLGNWTGNAITYAGGVHNMEDLKLLKRLGHNRLNVTIGSALDLFGGSMKWEEVLKVCRDRE